MSDLLTGTLIYIVILSMRYHLHLGQKYSYNGERVKIAVHL